MSGQAKTYDARMRQPEPPYRAIAGHLRGQIERGELLPGEQVPSVTRLAEMHGVSRATARRALQQLKDWGLTDAVPGWGTFVRGGESRT